MTLIERLTRWVRQLLARYYYGWALSHRYAANRYGLKGAYERAAALFSKALHWDPNFAKAYLYRGILNWRELDDPQQAVRDLTLAHEIDEALIEARFNRGIAYQELGDYASAIDDFEAYLEAGDHPYWREYAETMIKELQSWIANDTNKNTAASPH